MLLGRKDGKDGEKRSMDKITRAYQLIREFDRLPDNPDVPYLEGAVRDQMEELGVIKFSVFVCPKFNPAALLSPTPEEYMPTTANVSDLFRPRVPKTLALKDELLRLGIPIELNLIIGDNDAEAYLLPFLQGIKVDPDRLSRRQKLYERSFDVRVKRQLGQGCITWSLADLGIGPDEAEPEITEEEIARELRFFAWLFSEEGPYKGMFTFSKGTLRQMAKLKFRLYGNQGRFLEELGGILLQTEGPGVWLQRTQMLRCTGAKAVPAIYPWIRTEEFTQP